MTSWGGAYFGNPEENLFGPIGERPITVDEEPVIQSIRMVRKFIHGSDDSEALGSDYAGNIAPEAVLQWTEEPSRKPFTNGDAIMHRNWPYSIVINGAGDVFGEDLGVFPIPYGVTAEEAEYPMTGGPVAALGGWHMTLNPNSNDLKLRAALQVLQAMMTESFKLDMFRIIGWIPPEPSLLDSDEAAQVDVIGRYTQQLKVAGENAIPRPVTVLWPQQSGRISEAVNNTYAQEVPPQQAMTDLKSQLEEIENSA
jgi:ABC-type glycerol-3-phosphate transport system substrate-binding protein